MAFVPSAKSISTRASCKSTGSTTCQPSCRAAGEPGGRPSLLRRREDLAARDRLALARHEIRHPLAFDDRELDLPVAPLLLLVLSLHTERDVAVAETLHPSGH